MTRNNPMRRSLMQCNTMIQNCMERNFSGPACHQIAHKNPKDGVEKKSTRKRILPQKRSRDRFAYFSVLTKPDTIQPAFQLIKLWGIGREVEIEVVSRRNKRP